MLHFLSNLVLLNMKKTYTLWFLYVLQVYKLIIFFALKLYKIGNDIKSYSILSSLKAAWTTTFSNNYIRNRVNNQLCSFCVELLTNIKEN